MGLPLQGAPMLHGSHDRSGDDVVRVDRLPGFIEQRGFQQQRPAAAQPVLACGLIGQRVAGAPGAAILAVVDPAAGRWPR